MASTPSDSVCAYCKENRACEGESFANESVLFIFEKMGIDTRSLKLFSVQMLCDVMASSRTVDTFRQENTWARHCNGISIRTGKKAAPRTHDAGSLNSRGTTDPRDGASLWKKQMSRKFLCEQLNAATCAKVTFFAASGLGLEGQDILKNLAKVEL